MLKGYSRWILALSLFCIFSPWAHAISEPPAFQPLLRFKYEPPFFSNETEETLVCEIFQDHLIRSAFRKGVLARTETVQNPLAGEVGDWITKANQSFPESAPFPYDGPIHIYSMRLNSNAWVDLYNDCCGTKLVNRSEPATRLVHLLDELCKND